MDSVKNLKANHSLFETVITFLTILLHIDNDFLYPLIFLIQTKIDRFVSYNTCY